MPLLIQPSFAKGVLAPSLHGRADTAVYRVGLSQGTNAIIHTYGGVSNRPGTIFIGPCAEHTYAPRLIPFEFKTSDQYLLEFGNLYMRVIRNDGYVTETALTGCTATATNPVVVTKTSHGYSDGDEVYLSGFTEMVEVNTNRYIVANKTANTFELTNQADATNIDGTGFTAETTGGSSAKIYQIVTPYATADLDNIKYVQSADTMTLTHSNYPAQDLTRTAHNAWTIAPVAFVPAQDHPTGLSVTVNTAAALTRIYGVTAIKNKTFEESLTALNTTAKTISGATAANPVVITATSHGFSNGDEVEINSVVGMTELNGRRFIVSNKAANTFELLGTDGTGFTAYSSAGTANQTFVRITTSAATEDNTIAWTAVAGAEKYAVYRKDEDGLWGLIGETGGVSFEDDNLAPDTALTPPIYSDPISLADTYPGTTSYYEQRQVYGGSVTYPDTIYYSRIADRTNFAAADPAGAADAFDATLASRQVNEIRHLVPLNDLLVLTSGSEWRINSGPDQAFELASIRQKPQSFWGASHLTPFIVGSTVFFVEESSAVVRTMGYSFQLDGYTGTNIGLLANHYLYNNTIVDWAAQHSPEVRCYMARDDGKALTFTFDSEQEVIAWTDWATDGSYERVAALRHNTASIEDRIYFVVKRTINGNTVRYVEKLSPRINNVVEDCFFVDCGLTYDTPVTITAVTAANPPVVTAASHGFSNGDIVDISDITWVANVDSDYGSTQPIQAIGRYKVANKTANTFELTSEGSGSNIDGSAWNAYVSGGKVRATATVFRGLDHLEGETLVGNADGNVIRGQVVSGGATTLTQAAARVHLGMPYITDIETLDLEIPTANRTIQGVKKKIPAVTIKFEATRGLLIGPSSSLLDEIKQREFERMGEPTRLLTGSKRIPLKPTWNSNGRIWLRQKDPMPLTILSVVPEVEVGDV